MGLDMYLYKETYVKNWRSMTPQERHVISIVRGDGSPVAIRPERIAKITEELGYWRKANQVHNWFVQNCAGGVDECQRIHVSREQLEELLTACELVLSRPTGAEEVMPTQGGFFFGSTEYGEHYLEDLLHTVEVAREALASAGKFEEFVYQASW